MKGKDEIKDLFSDKLSGYEAKVNPELWANISANIGATSGAAATGLSVLAKTMIGIGVVAASITGVVLLTSDSPDEIEKTVEPLITEVLNTETERENQKLVVVEEKSDPITTSNNSFEENTNTNNIIQTVQETEQEDGELDSPEFRLPLSEQGGRIAEEDNPLNELVEEVLSQTEEEEEVLISEDEKQLEEEENTEVQLEEQEETKLVLSNIITPNNDMNNDFLFVESNGLSDFNVVILNTQNKVVYQSNDPKFRWNGIGMDGSPVESGNYVYFVTARDKNGQPVNQHSSLTIVR